MAKSFAYAIGKKWRPSDFAEMYHIITDPSLRQVRKSERMDVAYSRVMGALPKRYLPSIDEFKEFVQLVADDQACVLSGERKVKRIEGLSRLTLTDKVIRSPSRERH